MSTKTLWLAPILSCIKPCTEMRDRHNQLFCLGLLYKYDQLFYLCLQTIPIALFTSICKTNCSNLVYRHCLTVHIHEQTVLLWSTDMNQLFYFDLQTWTNCSTLVYRHESTVLPWFTDMNQLFYFGLQTWTNCSTLVYRHEPTVLPWSIDMN